MLRRPIRQSRAGREDGQAVVEFALVLPVLLLILIGIIQFGLAFYTYLELVSATREGARKASVSRTAANPQQDVTDAVKNAAGTLDGNKLHVTISPAPTWNSGDEVTVASTYNIHIDVLGFVSYHDDLHATSRVRIE